MLQGVIKNSSLATTVIETKKNEKRKEYDDFDPAVVAGLPYSTSTTPGKAIVMAVALSLATYIYNSYIRFHNGDPIVQTSLGFVYGNVAKSRDGRTYYEFLGVPYAEPPIDDLRFERPVPVKPWKGIRSAKEFGAECMQLEVMVTARVQGDENCLFLNIFTPLKTNKLLPTLVFLHGGLFMAGSSNMYRGKYFLDNPDIVLVTINYRLSSLGFLHTEDGVLKGNQGLWDQNLALLWVQKNIARFGGDPNRVTLFGESAGASSVGYHIISPHSAGLFQRAISQSGTALQIWAKSRSPKLQVRQLGLAMGCPVENSTVLVKCLKRVDARRMVRYHISSMSPIRRNTDLFVPSVDGDFLPAEPIELLKNGNFSHIPWMAGVNAGEGLLNTGRILASSHISEKLWKHWNEWIPLMLDYDPKRVDISWKIKQEYFKQLAGKPLQDETITNLTRIYSERVYFLDSRKAALMHAKYAPTYLYYYSYPGDISFFRLFKAVMPSHNDYVAPELKIAMDVGKDLIKKYLLRQKTQYLPPCHADELILQFNTHRLIEITRGSRDYAVSKALVKSWVDFAKASYNGTLTYQNNRWTPVDAESVAGLRAPKYMLINVRGQMIQEPFTKAIDFWKDLGF